VGRQRLAWDLVWLLSGLLPLKRCLFFSRMTGHLGQEQRAYQPHCFPFLDWTSFEKAGRPSIHLGWVGDTVCDAECGHHLTDRPWEDDEPFGAAHSGRSSHCWSEDSLGRQMIAPGEQNQSVCARQICVVYVARKIGGRDVGSGITLVRPGSWFVPLLAQDATQADLAFHWPQCHPHERRKTTESQPFKAYGWQKQQTKL
jgi:hypothetical protein